MASSLLALARSEQQNEKRFLRWRLIAHGGTLAVAVAALFVSDPLTYILALVAVATEATALGLRRYAQTLHERAERGRRHGFLEEALGPSPSKLEAAQIEAEFTRRARRAGEKWDDPKYWRTQGEGHRKGPALLRVNLQESAFWSWQLYKSAAHWALGRVVGFFLVLLFISLAFLSLGAGDGGQTFARVAAVVLAVLVSSDELGVMLSYFDAAGVAKDTTRDLTHADMSDLRSALSIYVDYQTATASAAPIPTSIYLRRHDEIQVLWEKADVRLDPATVLPPAAEA